MKTIEEMKNENGHFAIDGREYVLTEQAYFQSDVRNGFEGFWLDNYYCARAIRPGDELDEDGCQNCYLVRWEILDSYDPDWDGEDCACDWDNPSWAKEECKYGPEYGPYY